MISRFDFIYVSLCIACASVLLGHRVCHMLFRNGLSKARFEKRAIRCRRAAWGPRYYSSDSIRVTVLNLEPKSPNLGNRFEKTDFRKEVPNMDCFARYRVAT